jgi:hypothetical protein
MLFLDGGAGLILFGLWIFCVIDVITTDAARCRYLPKVAWILIVLLLPDIGSIVWLVAGHPWASSNARGIPYKGNTGNRFPEYERPGRFAATNPEDDDAFLAQVRDRAEAQRAAYQAKRKAELQAEQDRLHRKQIEE